MRSNGPPFVAFVASHLSSKDSFPILPDSYSILRVSIPPLLSALHHSYLRRRRSLRYEIEKRKWKYNHDSTENTLDEYGGFIRSLDADSSFANAAELFMKDRENYSYC